MNIRKLLLLASFLGSLLLTGCNSIPYATEQETAQAKSFPAPEERKKKGII